MVEVGVMKLAPEWGSCTSDLVGVRCPCTSTAGGDGAGLVGVMHGLVGVMYGLVGVMHGSSGGHV